jgi:hypothetical protein
MAEGKENLMFEALRSETGKPLLKDPETEIVYVGVKAGFSWPTPGARPFMAVMGQQQEDGALRVIHEGYEEHLDGIARRWKAIEDLYSVTEFLADHDTPINRHFEKLLDEIGCELERTFIVTQPRIPQDLTLATEIIRRAFRLNRLRLVKDGVFDGKIKEMNQADLLEPGVEDRFPEVQILANLINEFPNPREFQIEHGPRDAWEGEEQEEEYDWMAI